MILTGENRSTRKKTCPNFTLPTTDLIYAALGSNPGLGNDRTVTNRLSHGTNFKTEFHLNNIQKFSPSLTVNTHCSHYNDQSVNAVGRKDCCMLKEWHKASNANCRPLNVLSTVRQPFRAEIYLNHF